MHDAPAATETRPERRSLSFYRLLEALVILLLIGAAYHFGVEQGKTAGPEPKAPLPADQAVIVNETPPDRQLDFGLFWKVWDLVKEKYVDREHLDAREMLYGAINGMLSATDDPYTTFFDPEENREFNEKISGNFEGVGAEIGMRNNILTIVAPLEGSPAEKAGLRPNDKILKIDDQDATLYTLEEAVQRIRGPKGTEVTLTIFREGEENTREMKIMREEITVKSVDLEWREQDIAYLQVMQFGEQTGREFSAAVKNIVDRKAAGVVLDLRNNPGGLLSLAVEMAGVFLPHDTVVVIEEDGAGKQEKLFTDGGEQLARLPIVVLINEGSASASEILAGALRDNARDRTTLVGQKSYGKGSVQELIPVDRETAVKITVAKWLTPAGQQIDREGIKPDVEVEMTDEDYENERDPQLDRALEIMREKIAR